MSEFNDGQNMILFLCGNSEYMEYGHNPNKPIQLQRVIFYYLIQATAFGNRI